MTLSDAPVTSGGAPPPSASVVGSLPIAARFQGAWTECAARIQSRQLVNLHFAVSILTAGGLTVGLFDKAKLQDWTPVVSILLVVLTWMFSLWIRHNDAIIGLLDAFMKQCELLDDRSNTTGVPGWHRDDQEWIVLARQYRRLSDLAGIIATCMASVPSFFVGYWYLNESRPIGLGLLVAGICGLSASYFLYRNRTLRGRIAEGRFTGPPYKFQI